MQQSQPPSSTGINHIFDVVVCGCGADIGDSSDIRHNIQTMICMYASMVYLLEISLVSRSTKGRDG